MKTIYLYKSSIIISCVFYVLFFFAPWLYGNLDQESQSLLSYGGYKAVIELPDWAWHLFLALNIVAYIGIFLFRKIFLTLFLVLTVISFLMSSVNGFSVILGPEVFIIDISTFLKGVIVALAYYSELNAKFY